MATLAAGDKDEIALQVKDMLANNENISWAELSTKIAEQLGRQLNRKDRKFITGQKDLYWQNKAMQAQVAKSGVEERLLPNNFQVVTAYTPNYTIGELCAAINKTYCKGRGYGFLEAVMSYKDMMEEVAPRTNCTWFKIKLLLKLLKAHGQQSDIRYLVWVDADAIFLNSTSITLEHIVQKSMGRDLIIAEDQTYFLNAGVIILKASEWSVQLLEQVWEQRRYFETRHFEQSAILKVLKLKNEGFKQYNEKVYHSFRGGPAVKFFVHTVVFPPHILNSNVHESSDHMGSRWDRRNKAGLTSVKSLEDVQTNYTSPNKIPIEANAEQVKRTGEDVAEKRNEGAPALSSAHSRPKSAEFIYHPYGRRKKQTRLIAAINFHGIDCGGVDPFQIEELDFYDVS